MITLPALANRTWGGGEGVEEGTQDEERMMMPRGFSGERGEGGEGFSVDRENQGESAVD